MAHAPVSRLLAPAALALLTFGADDAQSTFPGANGRITFERGDDAREVFVMDASGGGQTDLTNNAAYDGEARWSPDGSKLVFASDRTGNEEIFVMNAGGSAVAQLTEDSATDTEPSWSPDGSKILFESNRDGNVEIYVMDANGANVTRLTNHPADDNEPAWSPDGTRILFHSDRDGSPDVFVMNANGSGQTNLTNHPAGDDNASWAPDSSRILFDSDRDFDFEIYVMNANGSGQTRITFAPGDDQQAVWSPDGTRIAFESNRDGNLEIYVMDADGGNQTRLTTNAVLDSEPDWGPAATGLTIDLTDDLHRWGANALIPYRITVTAQGVGQANVVVREIVPVNTTFSPADSTPGWVCDPGPQAESICTFPLDGQVAPSRALPLVGLGAGESRTLTFAARVNEGTNPLYEVFNEASLDGDPLDVALTAGLEHAVGSCICQISLGGELDCLESFGYSRASREHARASRARQVAPGNLDPVLYYRARDRVLHKRPGGRRLTQLSYQHVGDWLGIVGTNPQVHMLTEAVFLEWQPVFQALIDGSGAAVTITDAQVQAALAFLDALRAAANPALRQALDRERILFDPSGLAGMTAEEWLARVDRLSCERAPTFASLRCRVDELGRLVEGGGAGGVTAKRLRAALAKAAKRAEAAERADASGRTRPRRAALRKLRAALAAFGKRLGSARAARDVGEDLRALLTEESLVLRTDVAAMAAS